MDYDGYDVAWNGKTLRMGKLSAAVQQKFCNWVKQRALADAAEWMPVEQFRAYRQELTTGGVFWTTAPCPAVATAIGTREGTIYIHRLLFGDQFKEWADDEVWHFLESKQHGEGQGETDYEIAFALVWDAAHPKVTAKKGKPPPPSQTTPVPEATTETASAGTAS